MLCALCLDVTRQVLATAAWGPRSLERDWACSLVPLAMLGSNKPWLGALLHSVQTPTLRTAVWPGHAYLGAGLSYLCHVPTGTWQGFVLSGTYRYQAAASHRSCRQNEARPSNPTTAPASCPWHCSSFNPVPVLTPEPRLQICVLAALSSSSEGSGNLC